MFQLVSLPPTFSPTWDNTLVSGWVIWGQGGGGGGSGRGGGVFVDVDWLEAIDWWALLAEENLRSLGLARSCFLFQNLHQTYTRRAADTGFQKILTSKINSWPDYVNTNGLDRTSSAGFEPNRFDAWLSTILDHGSLCICHWRNRWRPNFGKTVFCHQKLVKLDLVLRSNFWVNIKNFTTASSASRLAWIFLV